MLSVGYDILLSMMLVWIFWLSEFKWFYSCHIMIHSITKESGNTDEFESEFQPARGSHGSVYADFQLVYSKKKVNNTGCNVLAKQNGNTLNLY